MATSPEPTALGPCENRRQRKNLGREGTFARSGFVSLSPLPPHRYPPTPRLLSHLPCWRRGLPVLSRARGGDDTQENAGISGFGGGRVCSVSSNRQIFEGGGREVSLPRHGEGSMNVTMTVTLREDRASPGAAARLPRTTPRPAKTPRGGKKAPLLFI